MEGALIRPDCVSQYGASRRFCQPFGSLLVARMKVSVRCSARERLRLLEKLDSAGRLRVVRPEEVRMRLRNGLFAVPKDGERDRMVLDARPPNLLEDASCPWINTLASVAQLAGAHLHQV